MNRDLIIGDILTLVIEEDDGTKSDASVSGLILLDIDFDDKKIEILDDWGDFQHIQWVPMARIKSVSREYKIIHLDENTDRYTGKVKLIAKLARVEKIFLRTGKYISYTSLFSTSDLDTFIIPVDNSISSNMLNFPEENVEINFEEFRKSSVLFDNKPTLVYYFDE
jgi:hypothetical protein